MAEIGHIPFNMILFVRFTLAPVLCLVPLIDSIEAGIYRHFPEFVFYDSILILVSLDDYSPQCRMLRGYMDQVALCGYYTSDKTITLSCINI